ncbi:hypothetical protein Tcan_16715 [Toxocara canis]|uniref:G-protein coupled receptors family 1 profile domain-containing protein n=1 Tax=Toxocara canis TaxID=6265 RepID=A0A0B2VD63_TOXCA|nr:hypothetical protein Tcan_16715 [Toxocara canis]
MLYMMLSAYFAYMHPFAYQRYFAKRRVLFDFTFILVLSLICAAPSTILSSLLNSLMPGIKSILIRAGTIWKGAVAVSLIIVAFSAIVATVKSNRSEFNKRRRFLTAFVFYTIPILILNLPTLISIIFIYVIQPLSPASRKLIPILRAMNEAVITIEQYRSIIISTCTILLLSSYRTAAVKMIIYAFRWRTSTVVKRTPAFVIRSARIS